jgi:hypothetical protein
MAALAVDAGIQLSHYIIKVDPAICYGAFGNYLLGFAWYYSSVFKPLVGDAR